MLKQYFAAFFAIIVLTSPALASDTLIMKTNKGDIELVLDANLAPNHVERIKTIANQGFYDGIVFHRVIEGFMAQTGDPTGTGMGGSELPDLKAEFSNKPFVRGSLGMARSQSPDSANSQFFIVYDRAEWLDGQYTLFGSVSEAGMKVADQLKKGSKSNNGLVDNPDRILEMRVK
jgi:peptidylprolyl isomerase